jgi:hypothetical protein
VRHGLGLGVQATINVKGYGRQRDEQPPLEQRSPRTPSGDGERKGLGRLGWAVAIPSLDEGGQRVLRDFFSQPDVPGASARVANQPRGQRSENLVKIHDH